MLAQCSAFVAFPLWGRRRVPLKASALGPVPHCPPPRIFIANTTLRKKVWLVLLMGEEEKHMFMLWGWRKEGCVVLYGLNMCWWDLLLLFFRPAGVLQRSVFTYSEGFCDDKVYWCFGGSSFVAIWAMNWTSVINVCVGCRKKRVHIAAKNCKEARYCWFAISFILGWLSVE